MLGWIAGSGQGSKMTPELEVWTSNKNRTEKHYFLMGGEHAYQDGRYLFGVNPQIVPPETEAKILELLKPIYTKVSGDKPRHVVKPWWWRL